MTKPCVSIVIPTYNQSQFVNEALESVLSQSFQNFEIIVINDGSTDNTKAVLSNFNDHIQIINQENKGLSEARNKGIQKARGDFIAFLDSDDLWVPEKLESQMKLLRNNPEFLWCYSDAEVFDSETGQTQYLYSQLYEHLYSGCIFNYLILENFIASPTPIVHRDVFEGVGLFFDNRIVAEDWDMWLRISDDHPVALIERTLARRRIHAGMKTRNRDWKKQYNRSVNTVERALNLKQGFSKKIKKEALSRLNIRIGRSLISKGKNDQARKLFRRAIQMTPHIFKVYMYWLASLLDGFLLKNFIQVRKKLREKKAYRMIKNQ